MDPCFLQYQMDLFGLAVFDQENIKSPPITQTLGLFGPLCGKQWGVRDNSSAIMLIDKIWIFF